MNAVRRLAILVGAAVVALALVASALVALGEISRPLVWRIPASFQGWVLMRYQDPACPPLTADGIFLVVRLDPQGQGCTSTSMAFGWTYERFIYVTASGVAQPMESSPLSTNNVIWARSDNPNRHEEVFFVGSRSALDRSWNARPDLPNRHE